MGNRAGQRQMSSLSRRDVVSSEDALLPDLIALCAEAQAAAEAYFSQARRAVLARVTRNDALDNDLLEREQFAVHGYGWCATYVTALGEMLAWARRLHAAGKLGECERLIVQAAFGEYLAQLLGGIPVSQVEI